MPTSCWRLGAKVHGAWELHEAASGQPLDWFCLFSSALAPARRDRVHSGQRLDAFARWRRKLRACRLPRSH